MVDAHPSWSIYFAKPADGTYGWAGRRLRRLGQGRARGHRLSDRQDPLEPRTRARQRLRRGRAHHRLRRDLHRRHATATSSRSRTTDGKTLWHAGTGCACRAPPITYELDGRQYVVTSSGGVLFAWALPEESQ